MDRKSVILELIKNRSYAQLRAELKDLEPADIALLLEDLSREELLIAYRVLNKETAAQAFVYMDADAQQTLIEAFSDAELAGVLDELFLDDTVDIIEEMPATVVKRILRLSDQGTRAAINQILKYPGDSAGSIMTIEYVDLKADFTVAKAFERIRGTGVDKETIYTCYVTDENRRLTGLVTVRTLLLSNPGDIIGDIMETNIISAATLDDKEEVARMFDKYDFLAIPVVDKENRLVGIVTVDDALDVIQEAESEDFAKMGAVSPLENSYFRTSVFSHSKKRIIWLLLLMLSATLSGIILNSFDDAFLAFPLLVSFVPMLMDTGGNCGAQASVLIIRGLALGEVKFTDLLRVIWKEIRIALFVGTSLALVNAVRVMVMYGDARVALVTGITLIMTALLAKILGGTLPILAKRIRLDPALMASPLITTIVDACAILFFFSIAKWLLHI